MRSLSYAENTVRALPNDSEGHYYVGLALRELGRWSDALPHLEHSIALDPANSPGWNALLDSLVYLRRKERFLSSLEKLAATNPGQQTEFFVDRLRFLAEGYLPPTMPGPAAGTFARLMWLWRSRRFEELVEATRLALRVNATANSNTFERLTWQCDALRRLERETEAAAAARELAQIVEQMNATPQRNATSKLRRTAVAAVRLGRVDEAITAAQRAIAACAGPTVSRRWAQELLLAEIYAYVGRARESVPLIEKLLAVPSGLTVPRLKLDPIWDKVRDDPAFKALLADPKNSAPL